MKKEANHIENTYFAWSKLKEDIENNAGVDFSSDEVVIGVNVSCNAEKIESDILTLQYFFPIADFIRKKYKKKTKLIIALRDCENANVTSTENRIQHYLCVQAILRESVSFEIFIKENGEEKRKEVFKQTSFGHIVPIMAFTQQDTQFYYKNAFYNTSDIFRSITGDGNTTDFFRFLMVAYEALRKYDALKKEETLSDVFNGKEFKLLLCYNKVISKSFIEAITNLDTTQSSGEDDQQTSSSYLNRVFNIDSEDMLDMVYFKLFMNNMKNIFLEKIKGTTTKPLSAKIKRELVINLCKYIQDMNVPVFALYLWSCLIKHMFDENLLINYDGEQPRLIMEQLEKAQYDAMSYTEGIYQLIENAVIHSEGHCGYLSLRLHYTDRNCAQHKLHDVADRIALLRQKYKSFGTLDARYHLEISLIDNSYSFSGGRNIGMLEKAGNVEFANLQELFTRNLVASDTISMEDIIVHYGLRVFEKMVILNGGYFHVSSPESGEYYAVLSQDKKIKRKNDITKLKGYGGTVYNIIIPVYIPWESHLLVSEEKQTNHNADFMFETDGIKKDYTPYIIPLDFSPIDAALSKIEMINALYNQFTQKLQKIDVSERVVYLHPKNITFQQIELLAKMLCLYSVRIKDNVNDKRHLLAIQLDKRAYINEFVRIYAVFYDRTGNLLTTNRRIDTQIAFCSESMVRFILCGEKLQSVKQSARLYAYYNSDASLEFVHTVRYLTRTEEDDEQAVLKPIFPFDLYLDICNNDLRDDTSINTYNNRQRVDEKDIWFHQKINKILDTDMRDKSYGCKIDNIHISIGTKIHINTFYNAELLFHNYGNVCRFAYMIAREILKEHHTMTFIPPRKKICLVGYEEYSSLLLCQIKQILSQCDVETVDYLTFLSAYDETEDQTGKFWPDFYEYVQTHNLSEYTFSYHSPYSHNPYDDIQNKKYYGDDL